MDNFSEYMHFPQCCVRNRSLGSIKPQTSSGAAHLHCHLSSSSASTLVQASCTSGEGNDNPLQYSCLENPMDGGAWWAAVHGVARSQTRLSYFTFTFHFHALEKEMHEPTPVFLPGESQGKRSLVGCRLWGRTESDTTDAT